MFESTKDKFLPLTGMQVIALISRQRVLISLLIVASFVIGMPSPVAAEVSCPTADGTMLVIDEDTAECTEITNALPPPPANGAQFRTFSGFTSIDIIRVVAGAPSPPTSVSCPGATISVFPGAGTSVSLTPGTTCQVTATFDNPGGLFTVTGQLAVSAGSRSSAANILVNGGAFVRPEPEVTEEAKDTDSPKVTISAPTETRVAFTTTFTFSESVIGFKTGDITVGNGTASNFSAKSGSVYTALITPTGSGNDTITIDVKAGVAQDAAGNGNISAARVSISYINEYFVRTRTQRVVSNFISQRADQITANTPEIYNRLLSRGGTGGGAPVNFTVSGTPENHTLFVATSLNQIAYSITGNKGLPAGELSDLQGVTKMNLVPELDNSLDIWIKGNLSHIDSGSTGYDLGQVYAGLDYRLNERVLLGVLAQVDWSDNNDSVQGIATDGTGWFTGPYIAARVYDNIIFDGLISYGQSDNDVTAVEATGSFDTDRFFIKGQLTGNVNIARWHIEPFVALIYFEEEQKEFTNSLDINIPSQTIDLGRVIFGPKISTQYTIGESNGIAPYFGLVGIWDFNRTENVDLETGLTAGTDDLRGRVNGGVAMLFANGWKLNGEGYYDGIGADDFDAYGGSLRIEIPFN